MAESLRQLSDQDRETYAKLGTLINSYSLTPDAGTNVSWAKHRNSEMKRLGDNALIGLVPENINRVVGPITRTLNGLARMGIITMQDLVNVDMKDLEIHSPRDFGKKSIEITQILKDISVLELNRIVSQESANS